MIELIFATQNQHKVQEIATLLPQHLRVITMGEVGITQDIPEPHDTITANAHEKSKTIYALTGKNCFGEDTGLVVPALNGEPGVKSARYAGNDKNFEANINKLLQNMASFTVRDAYFLTVISLVWQGNTYTFEGRCDGTITNTPRGTGGFGYDAVFKPLGSDKTFAEMLVNEKNKYSHRRKAVDALLTFLNTQVPL
ncbi:MAG: RdgB/HAM1 family non-canonical purine NTP pyrophosphatase [Chitinophagaceae bacterium]